MQSRAPSSGGAKCECETNTGAGVEKNNLGLRTVRTVESRYDASMVNNDLARSRVVVDGLGGRPHSKGARKVCEKDPNAFETCKGREGCLLLRGTHSRRDGRDYLQRV